MMTRHSRQTAMIWLTCQRETEVSTTSRWISEEDRARAALSYVPPDDRQTWVEMAYAVKHGFGEAGFDMWDVWSQGGASYDVKSAKAVWKSVQPNGRVSLASLFWRAEQHGFDLSQHQVAPPDAGEQARARAQREAREAAAREAVLVKREAAAHTAMQVWAAAAPAAADHPYLARKGVAPVESLREIDAGDLRRVIGYTPKSDGVPLEGRVLVAPVKLDGRVSSIEFIDSAGRKSALAGGAKAGGYWASGPLADAQERGLTIAIGEGIATLLSAHEAAGCVVVAALSCHNLPKVAQALREAYPHADLVVLADRGNGQEHAERAAQLSAARLAVPQFGHDERIDGAVPSDFNDVARLHGRDAVAQAMAQARTPERWISTHPSHRSASSEPPGPVQIRDHDGRTLYEHPQPGAIGEAVEAAVGRGVSLAGAVLSRADLDGRDLAGANLAHADLRRASLREADLQDACLRGADVSGADFSGASLRGTDLSGTLGFMPQGRGNVEPAMAHQREGVQIMSGNEAEAPVASEKKKTSSRSSRKAADVSKASPEEIKGSPLPGAARPQAAGPAVSQPESKGTPSENGPKEPASQSERPRAGAPLHDLKDVPPEVKAAAQQRFGHDIRMGVPRENGLYKGEVYNTDRYLVQEVATRSVVFHEKPGMEFVDSRLKWCNENQRLNGADVQVGYTGDKAKVYPFDRQRDQLEKTVASLKKSAKELGLGEEFGKQLDTVKEKSWDRVKEARSTALEQAKARQGQQPAKTAEGPDR